MSTSRNRLDEEASPYLRQHADNPVHWQPWDDDALDAARERDVPIFLSIGYSACHWCHVMADESFDDPIVAERLNKDFVPIKVDREERPDLDRLYQTVAAMVSGQGGWPLSVWLTPDGRPFYVGTYFPREAKRGQPGFLDLLDSIADSWDDEREDIESRADQWANAMAGELEDTPDSPGEVPQGLLETAAQRAVSDADREHGGFGRGQKFPQTGRLHLLMQAYERTGRDAFREIAVEALDAMADGGLRDHAGGGFHRYVTDREWTVPHFEKMLYDNAELVRAYLAGYRLTGEERYAEIARETLGFVERELRHPDGGFFSTLDAQSEGESGEHEEGAFYVWTPPEVHETVDDEFAADLFCERYGITEAGNFEDGRTVLTLDTAIDDLADEHGTTTEEIEADLERAREAIFAARADRDRPARDEKVLAGWNGLMISAFAEAGLALDETYGEMAVAALDFVREQLWDEKEQQLARRFKDGEVKIDGYLEDYAFLARGALNCYEATGEVEYLTFALDLGRAVVREFFDAEEGTLYFTPQSGESLVARPQELDDQSTPSSTGVAVDTLLALSQFAPDREFGKVAETVLETHAESIEASPLRRASLALAANRHTAGSLELTVVADELPTEWRERIGRTYLPKRLLARRPPTDAELDGWLDRLSIDDAPPIWADRTGENGEPTAYVCRAFTCSPPQTEIDEALSWADRLAPESPGSE
ncbi:thioredoxin domain-containing protein [Halococcus dombrowskii]|uniref:Thioredoxin domain-containing protein n=1 Tax=Halococcus dombrowskii TaxID=179637 RepID=A0AAV3SHU9_HALDO|nr:thioredoxin domain-containing protein [Halococcus dombrowskii]UOO93897.1 thioredoxin domain-containing protein [Halococcus dombrowskii]